MPNISVLSHRLVRILGLPPELPAAGDKPLAYRDTLIRPIGIASALALALAVAACGADGEPLPPPGAQNPVDVNAPKPAPEEGERPTRRFILDGLL
ncbi:MAG: hypothetical protein AAGD23_03890 [Pseudomonadota bacterium]